jgi:hypothetical protein
MTIDHGYVPLVVNTSRFFPVYGIISYQDVLLDRVLLLTRKLLDQGFLLVKLKSAPGL